MTVVVNVIGIEAKIDALLTLKKFQSCYSFSEKKFTEGLKNIFLYHKGDTLENVSIIRYDQRYLVSYFS